MTFSINQMGNLQQEDKCTCLREVEQKTLKHVEERNKHVEGFEIIESESGFDNISYLPKHQLFIQYNARYMRSKKNGKPSVPATKKVNIFFTYCPFCGVKINE